MTWNQLQLFPDDDLGDILASKVIDGKRYALVQRWSLSYDGDCTGCVGNIEEDPTEGICKSLGTECFLNKQSYWKEISHE